MTKVVLKASPRQLTGRKVKYLRKEGIIPANIFGKDVKSVSIQVDKKEFKEVFKKVGETGIIELHLGDDLRPSLVSDIAIHPATSDILHIDFKQVNLKERVTASIPVEIVGESPAEKGGIGTVVLLLQELEVEALPTDLPEKFEIDALKLTDVDQVVKISDLKYDKSKVEIKADPELIVAKVEPPQKEEVVEAPSATQGEETTEAGEVKQPEGEAQEKKEVSSES